MDHDAGPGQPAAGDTGQRGRGWLDASARAATDAVGPGRAGAAGGAGRGTTGPASGDAGCATTGQCQ
ncbi:hypothetical protein ABTF01_21040, partial [Acinetobacter baumannii]